MQTSLWLTSQISTPFLPPLWTEIPRGWVGDGVSAGVVGNQETKVILSWNLNKFMKGCFFFLTELPVLSVD